MRVRRLGFVLVALFVGLQLPTSALAADKFAAEFLKIGVGARAQGMGGAFVSLANDASAAYWNPAGLVQLDHREAMAMHASQFGGTLAHNFGSVVIPMDSGESRSAIGITAVLLSVDGIRVTKDAKVGEDIDGNPEIDESLIRSESAYDLALMLTYSKSLSDRLSAGVNLKLVRQSLVSDASSFGIGADLGFLYRPKANFALGIRLADLTTTQLYWDSGRRETVAPTIAVGAHTTRFLNALRGTLTLGVNADFAFESQEADQFSSGSLSGNFLPGLEYWYENAVALRLGSDGGDLTAGGGVRYRQFGVDYAFFDHSDLDATHRISALYRF